MTIRPKRSPVRSPALWLAAAVVIAVAGFAWQRTRPVSVEPTAVVRKDIARTLVLTGRVRPPGRSRLGTSVAGTVREVLVREGDHVARGQLLVTMDDAQPLAALGQARASLAAAEARSQSTADQAAITSEQASRDLKRAQSLYAAGAISARDVEVASRAATAARSELDVARARMETDPSRPLADVARARDAVAAAQAVLALTRVTAPVAATVLTRAVEPGDAVLPGKELLGLALDGASELVVFLREENIADLRIGATAVASADAFPRSSFAARVVWVAPVIDPAQGTVEVRLAVPAPPAYLRPDMTVSINAEVARRSNVLVVPRAMVHDPDSAEPWVALLDAGRAVRRTIHLGVKGDTLLEVTDGLAEGDQVLPAGTAPGRRVRVTTITR